MAPTSETPAPPETKRACATHNKISCVPSDYYPSNPAHGQYLADLCLFGIQPERPDDWVINGFPESTERHQARLNEMERPETTPNVRDRIIPLVNLDLEDRTLTLTW